MWGGVLKDGPAFIIYPLPWVVQQMGRKPDLGLQGATSPPPVEIRHRREDVQLLVQVGWMADPLQVNQPGSLTLSSHSLHNVLPKLLITLLQ